MGLWSFLLAFALIQDQVGYQRTDQGLTPLKSFSEELACESTSVLHLLGCLDQACLGQFIENTTKRTTRFMR
ncbi:MAG: hypothetical protein COZ34_01460 [Candidatus Pacebacteria bacterium CG_4_10_14_3_um_filter_34_15]|nr:MAG: hypothetical protein COV78_02895 [Candidatus Pacebacteria bacterium CG11_big_fil_rev_8_21_14_0_20_34_55]PIX81754.1 MAG: hypothetical protein COZ34_01460 [Candidatus Pacebacteria bacterium CG_4_10_14_3_um_filter_34_15]